jgi:small subunit ribosomal protein S16
LAFPRRGKIKKKENKMAVAIRLQRHGGKKHPYYHIVAADSRVARDSGSILETLGKYDPMQPRDSDRRVIFNEDKVKSWMAKGAKPSDRVYKFLANAGLLPKRDVPNQTKKNQPSEKTLAKLKAREEKLSKASEAPIEETPATEQQPVEAPEETPAEQPAEEAPATEPEPTDAAKSPAEAPEEAPSEQQADEPPAEPVAE